MHHLFPVWIKRVVDTFCLSIRLSFTPPHLLFFSPNFSWQPSVCCQAVSGWQRAGVSWCASTDKADCLVSVTDLLSACWWYDPQLKPCVSVFTISVTVLPLYRSTLSLCPSACVTLWPDLTTFDQAWLNGNRLAGKRDNKTLIDWHFKAWLNLMGNKNQNSCF